MQSKIAKAIVQLSVVALTTISAGIADAQVKVACVGDSITALPSSWCGGLSTKLGSGYMVRNFGVSGTNLLKGVAQPYWNSAQYAPSHTFAPNIVIIMLGTNDAFARSWSSNMSHFVKDYEELLDTYTTLASKPKPYIIIPTPIGTSPFGHDGKILATGVVPLVKQVAMNKMVPTIDAFTLFGGEMFDTSLFNGSDQVHPSAKGQALIADNVHMVLMSTGALGGPGAVAGSGGSTNAGSGGMAGTSAGSAGSANAGSGGIAGASANPGGAGGGAGAMSASGTGAAGRAGGSANTAGSANTSGSPSLAGTGASATAGSSTGSSVNPIGAAGMSGPMVPAPESSSDGGCRTAGNLKSESGPAVGLLLLLGVIAIRGRRRTA